MIIKEIDVETWERKDPYLFFSQYEWPYYCLMLNMDVTRLVEYCHERKQSFYFSLIYLITETMNEVEIYRYRVRDGRVVVVDTLQPHFTDLVPGSRIYVNRTLPIGNDMAEFTRKARQNTLNASGFVQKTDKEKDEAVYCSCVPAVKNCGITNPRRFNPEDCVPRVNWGGYEKQADGRITLVLSLDVNHRFIYGQDVADFQTTLQEKINKL